MTWLDTVTEKALARELPARAGALRGAGTTLPARLPPLLLHGCALTRHTPYVL